MFVKDCLLKILLGIACLSYCWFIKQLIMICTKIFIFKYLLENVIGKIFDLWSNGEIDNYLKFLAYIISKTWPITHVEFIYRPTGTKLLGLFSFATLFWGTT